MRPIVKAVGLICILAHDYLIVKMEMLFRYSITVVDHKLSVDAAPILTTACPFFRDVPHSQIQHLKKAVICRKYGLGFGDLLQLAIEAFYGIGRICVRVVSKTEIRIIIKGGYEVTVPVEK